MPQTYRLAAVPAEIVERLLEHFNSLDVSVMIEFYDKDAILVNAAGVPQRGRADVALELQRYFAFGLPMQIVQRHLFVAGGIASLVLDWSIKGKGPDGKPVNVTGTANDIARRGEDGLWRYLIDNPFGTQIRTLS